jgi:DNA (cytosine-5)-methyltransferase 1
MNASSAVVGDWTMMATGARHWSLLLPLTTPLDTITTKDHNALVTARLRRGTSPEQVRAFLMAYYATDQQGSLSEPLQTVTTHDRFALVTVRGEAFVIEDIGMRLLTPRELFRAQGFPDSYVIDRALVEDEVTSRLCELALTKTQQVHMCGNSVPPVLSQALATSNLVNPPTAVPRFASGSLF